MGPRHGKPESIRDEAARRGVTPYRVIDDRTRRATGQSYGQVRRAAKRGGPSVAEARRIGQGVKVPDTATGKAVYVGLADPRERSRVIAYHRAAQKALGDGDTTRLRRDFAGFAPGGIELPTDLDDLQDASFWYDFEPEYETTAAA